MVQVVRGSAHPSFASGELVEISEGQRVLLLDEFLSGRCAGVLQAAIRADP